MRRACFLSASILALLCGAAEGGSLTDYRDVAAALERGKDVSLALDLSECTDGAGQRGPAIKAGLPVAAYMDFGNRIVFSGPHFTVPPGQERPTIEFVRYELSRDGIVTVNSSVFRLPGYEKGAERHLRCKQGAGAWFYD
jgi:hypothetical protein